MFGHLGFEGTWRVLSGLAPATGYIHDLGIRPGTGHSARASDDAPTAVWRPVPDPSRRVATRARADERCQRRYDHHSSQGGHGTAIATRHPTETVDHKNGHIPDSWLNGGALEAQSDFLFAVEKEISNDGMRELKIPPVPRPSAKVGVKGVLASG